MIDPSSYTVKTYPAHGAATGDRDSFGAALDGIQRKMFPPVSFIVPDVLPEGCTILAGRPKLGKSWLAFDIAINVARRGFVLGDKECSEGDVLYLALEDNERRIQTRARKMLGDADPWPSRVTIATEWPRAGAGGLDKIKRWCRSVLRPRLVIVDVLTAFRDHPGPNEKKSTYATDYDAVAGLRDLAQEMNIAVLVVHHVRKDVTDDPIEAVSGTLGLSGAADTIIVLNRKAETGTTLYGRGRDIEEYDLALEWMNHTCRWRIRGATVEVKRSDERTEIMKAVREAGEALTPTEIAAEVGMKSVNVRKLLSKMVRDGELEKVQRSRYGIVTATDTVHTDHNDMGAYANVTADDLTHPGHTGHSDHTSEILVQKEYVTPDVIVTAPDHIVTAPPAYEHTEDAVVTAVTGVTGDADVTADHTGNAEQKKTVARIRTAAWKRGLKLAYQPNTLGAPCLVIEDPEAGKVVFSTNDPEAALEWLGTVAVKRRGGQAAKAETPEADHG